MCRFGWQSDGRTQIRSSFVRPPRTPVGEERPSIKAISTRIRKLEVGAGIIETEESRREREFEETIRRRIAEGRARLRLSPRAFTD